MIRTVLPAMTLCLAVGLVLGLGMVPAAAQGAPAYTVTDLGTLGGDCYPLDLNLRGQVVGTCREAAGNEQAFLYENGVMRPLGTLGGIYSYANAINLPGDVVGDSATTEGVQHAYLWHNGAMTDLGTPGILGDRRSQANGINSRGQIVGWAYPDTGTYHAFLYENGVMTDIGTGWPGWSIATDIDELGRIVGYYQADGGMLPFLRVAGTMTTLATLGGTSSGANEINLFREVAGWSSYPDTGAQPVIFRGASATDLGSLGGSEGSAWGINDLGDAVGYSNTSDENRHAILYHDGVLYDLNDLIPPGSGVELMTSAGIDDLGRIAGSGCFGGLVEEAKCTGGQIRPVLLKPTSSGTLGGLIELIGDLDLPKGTENSLLSKLEHALNCADTDDVACMCHSLKAFTNEVSAQAGKKITDEEAQLLLAAAQGLMGELGCP
jgi:probable HAF family extracellular repeat protein